MNIETINKWLDEEYGCSYTKLEELHDFYFEKYCDLQQENKQLKEKLDCDLQWAFKYEKQVDNWNKLKEYVKENLYFYSGLQGEDLEINDEMKDILDKMQEMEKGDSNE